MPPKKRTASKRTATTKKRPHIVLVPIPSRRGQQRGGSFLSDLGDTFNGTLRGASQMGMQMLPMMMMGRM